ncbi:hypothetical protein FHS46_004210 [Variibacter gotjawalensis]|nr:hypothetical protein [Variibacter gotjawalensis]
MTIAFFGIRGVGSIHYLAFAINKIDRSILTAYGRSSGW